MPLGTLAREVQKLKQSLRQQTATPSDLLSRLRSDPLHIMTVAGMKPDPWQRDLLQSTASRIILNCCRQSGKSTLVALLSLREALTKPPALILLVSPSQRQSAELLKRVTDCYRLLNYPVAPETASILRLELANGSRVVSLPGKEQTVRSFSGVRLLAIDEAARVPEDLYRAVRPMLAVSQGRLVLLSTPFGRRGFFYEAWSSSEPWQRFEVPAEQCPRIGAEFLQQERRELGERHYLQEFACSFQEATGQVFNSTDIAQAFTSAVQPLELSW
jgi:hypothetical protein